MNNLKTSLKFPCQGIDTCTTYFIIFLIHYHSNSTFGTVRRGSHAFLPALLYNCYCVAALCVLRCYVGHGVNVTDYFEFQDGQNFYGSEK